MVKVKNFKGEFCLFVIELLSTGFCFVRLAITGKLIKACSPFYVVWLILSQYLEGFNNMIAKIGKKNRKNEIIIFFFKYYNFSLFFCLFLSIL